MAIEVNSRIGRVDVTSAAWEAEARGDSPSVDVESGESTVEFSTGILVGGVPYAGDYEARALFSEQTFPTALKTMQQDFAVHAINYTEAPNDYGVTVTIGG